MASETAVGLYASAAREALRSFPIAARDVELIAVSENVTFRVVDHADGQAYALRLHRPGYHALAALESEPLWTEALNRAGIAAPRAIRSSDGRYYVSVTVPASGERRFAGLARWTDGEVLSEVMAREPEEGRWPGWFERLGAILAAMHAQASAWRPPAAFSRHHLDGDGLLGEAPFWGRFWEHPILTTSESRLLSTTREAIRAALGRYGQASHRYSVIHADPHPGNVLIHDGGLALIDFDDAGFGWHLYDIAVALIHQQDRPDFSAVRDAFMSGYRSVRALAAEDEAMLPLFLLVRGMAQIGWLHQRPEHSGPEHLDYLRRIRSTVIAQCERFTAPC